MTDDKMKELLRRYRTIFTGVEAVQLPAHAARRSTVDAYGDQNPGWYEHLAWICEEAGRFIDEGRRDKAVLWLGFVQGFYCARGVLTLDELKGHRECLEDS